MRSLLLLITILPCLLGWVVIEQRQSKLENEVGLRLQGDQRTARGNPVNRTLFLGAYDSLEFHEQKKAQGWWRDLARLAFGERILQLHLSAPVPQEALGEIAKLESLQELSLDTTRIPDLEPISSLKNLKTLHLYRPGFGCKLTHLAELKNLEWLTLSGTSDNNLTPLSELVNLKALQITATTVTDLSPLKSLHRLELLDLTNSSSVSDLSPLVGLSKLEELKLEGTSASDLTPLAHLKNLKRLHLGLVSDLAPLAEVKTLEVLSVSGTSTMDEQVKLLQMALPNCKINR